MKQIKKNILKIKQSKPLVLCLTNAVTMDFVANCLLSLGAAPIMCDHKDELEELIEIASSVYINIGTLNIHFIDLCLTAASIAKRLNKPVILDPVGCSATKSRYDLTIQLIPFCNILRGNASEIMSIQNNQIQSKGVDSLHCTEEGALIAKKLAKKHDLIIAISGETDYVTNGLLEKKVYFGSPIMANITGTGCALTACVAAFKAVEQDSFIASTDALEFFGLAGNIAFLSSQKPCAFKMVFMDQLYEPNFDLMTKLYNDQELVYEI